MQRKRQMAYFPTHYGEKPYFLNLYPIKYRAFLFLRFSAFFVLSDRIFVRSARLSKAGILPYPLNPGTPPYRPIDIPLIPCYIVAVP